MGVLGQSGPSSASRFCVHKTWVKNLSSSQDVERGGREVQWPGNAVKLRLVWHAGTIRAAEKIWLVRHAGTISPAASHALLHVQALQL
jgi:hypothetical protein